MVTARPIVATAGAAVLGAAAVIARSPDQRATIALALITLVVCTLRARTRPHLIRVAVALALVCGALLAWTANAREVTIAQTRMARFSATVLDVERDDAAGTTVELSLDSGLRVLATTRIRPLPGERVIVRGKLEPFDDPRNPGEPSERDLMRERGLDARIAHAQIVALVARATPSTLERLRIFAHDAIVARLPQPDASVLMGELWGERADLPPNLHAAFMRTGTIHILVTAGLHVGVIAWLATVLFRRLPLPRASACAVTALLVWAFVCVSGLHLPSVRAATMATYALTARAFGRTALSWNALAFAAIVVVCVRPLDVTGASFALSFSCVGAILICAKPLERGIRERFSMPDRVREAVVLTVATQVGTWPLTAAIFLQWTPYAVIGNLCVVPVVGATMLLGIGQIALNALPFVAQALANVNDWLLTWITSSVTFIAALPGASIPMTPAPSWCIAAYDASLVAALALGRRAAYTPMLALLIVCASLIVAPPRGGGAALRITALDVGQADAIVVRTPLGHTLLIDAGGRLERGADGGSSAEAIGERIVVPFLLRQGIHRLDAIVLSHPHGDHAGGVAPVMRAMPVALFDDGGQRYSGAAYRDALATANGDSIRIEHPRGGDVLHTDDGVTLKFIGPQDPLLTNTRNDINENSIAFLLVYRHFRMLFTGDAGAAAEQRFLALHLDLHADVLKVGHHGSSYSSTPAFIAAVHPADAIISVGRDNMFGHPAPSTLETLERFGARVYRTDKNGAVTITTDGTTHQIQTMF